MQKKTVLLKKPIKILFILLLVVLGIFVSIAILINVTPVQNFVVRQVSHRLSKQLHTEVSVKHVDFRLFNKFQLEGTFVADQKGDTLLYAEELDVNITNFFFLKNHSNLYYIGMKDVVVNMDRPANDSTWNFQFIIDAFANPDKDKSPPPNLSLQKIRLENIHLNQKDNWKGKEMQIAARHIAINAQNVSLPNHNVRISSIKLDHPLFIQKKDKERMDSMDQLYPSPQPIPPKEDSSALRWNKDHWNILIDKITLNEGAFVIAKENKNQLETFFDPDYINFYHLNGNLINTRFVQDSLISQIDLTAKERGGLKVNKLQGRFKMSPITIEVANLDLKTNESHIKDYFALQFDRFGDLGDFTTKVTMKGNFVHTFVTSNDIGFFAPPLKDWKKEVEINGLVQGTLDRLEGDDLQLSSGKSSKLEGNFSMTGLPDIYNTFIDFQIKDLKTTGRDIQHFLPMLKQNKAIDLNSIKSLQYQGNYSGFIFDFVSYGDFTTNLGKLHTDINFKFGPEHTPASYSGKISSSGFQLGTLLNQKQLGKAAFNTHIQGQGFSLTDVDTKMDGDIDLLEFKNYPYRHISMDGALKKKLFEGHVEVADSNLAFVFNGDIDFTDKVPAFKFDADIQKSHLKKLNLTKDSISFSGKLDLDLIGNNIDDFLGDARLFDINLYKNTKRIALDTLVVNSGEDKNDQRWLTLRGNGFSGYLHGQYKLSKIPDAILELLHHYFPKKIEKPKSKAKDADFEFAFNFGKIDSLFHTFAPQITHLNGGQIKGKLNTAKDSLKLDLNLNQGGYRGYVFNDIRVRTKGTGQTLKTNNIIGEVYLKDSLLLPETDIETFSRQDTSLITLKTIGNIALNKANIKLRLIFLEDGFNAKFLKSILSLNDKEWLITPDNDITIQKKDIHIHHFKLSHNNQEITLTSTEDSKSKNAFLVQIKNLKVHDFTQLFLTGIQLEGVANGEIKVRNPLDSMYVKGQLSTQQFRINDDSIGTFTASSTYDKNKKEISWDVQKKDDPDKNFNLTGSVGTGQNTKLQGEFNLNHTDIGFLQNYVAAYVSNLKGKATGKLSLSGDKNHPDLLGSVKLNDVKFLVNYTKVEYTIDGETIHFNPGEINMGSMVIKDSLNQVGVLTGSISHHYFQDIFFNVHLNTQGLALINTTIEDNPLYYGHVVGAGKVDFTGPITDMKMVINASPLEGTHIYLPLSDEKDLGDHDFIVFKEYGKALQPPDNKNKANLSVKLFADMNPSAQVDVIVDATSGDHITARGNGALQMNVDLNGGFNIYGNYAITEGKYIFSFKGLLTREFAIDQGSAISWNGDPFNANINITAIYHVPGGANLYNLISGDEAATAGMTKEDKRLLRQREDIDVYLSLKNSLMHPDITYDIRIPDASISASSLAVTKLQEIRQNPNTLINQVAGLLAAGQFIPISSGNASGNILRSSGLSSAGQWVSSQLTGVLNNLFSDQLNDLGVSFSLDYSTYSSAGDQGDIFRNDVQFNVSKNLFNNRVQLQVGPSINWGRASAASNSNNSYFAGDFRLEYLINPSGQLRFVAFSRSNYNILLNHNLTRAGIGLSYSHQFDELKDLFINKAEKKRRDSVQRAKFEEYLQQNNQEELQQGVDSTQHMLIPDKEALKEEEE